MAKPRVVISYSRRDVRWKDKLVEQLSVLEKNGVCEVWYDSRLLPGDNWPEEILRAMQQGDVAVLLLSASFLTSSFIRETELPLLLAKVPRVIPLLIKPCPWEVEEKLKGLNVRPEAGPKGLRALSLLTPPRQDEALASFVKEIADLFPHLDLGRLPTPGPHFVGREGELEHLDAAWRDPDTNILTLFASGGVGKSALVARWLERLEAEGWRGADQVLDWSFFCQGRKDCATSAELFIDHALRFLGDPNPKAGSPRDRGARLAALVQNKRTLLVLDGVEPLQYAHDAVEKEGQLSDPGLAALLKALAVKNQGLCIITTRQPIEDLSSFKSTARQISLGTLELSAAEKLLRLLGVTGSESEVRDAAQAFERHALSLSLLGNFLRRVHGGDIQKRGEIDLEEERGVSSVIAANVRRLGEGPELAILRLLGLFDRPADLQALRILLAAPVIPGLSEHLVDLSFEGLQTCIGNLRSSGLLAATSPRNPETLDSHPLVRAFFAAQIESRTEAWQEANRRIYEHRLKEAQPQRQTLEAVEPLYAAIVHGCRAGKHQEAMDETYGKRGLQNLSLSVLGSFGSDLAALASFFDRPWFQPSPRLSSAWQKFVLNQAVRDLGFLGRLKEQSQAQSEVSRR